MNRLSAGDPEPTPGVGERDPSAPGVVARDQHVPGGHRRRRPSWARWRDEAAIGLLLAGGAAALALSGWSLRADRVVYDTGLALSHRGPPAGVLIIAIDDASVQAIGRWPWSRAVHATLLERLAAAHPRSIFLDLLLSEPDPDPEQDRLLARALKHAAPVVLPLNWQPDGAGRWQALLPAPALRGVAALGAAQASVESDGVLRDAFLSTRSVAEDQGWPLLAQALLQAGGQAVHPRTLAAVEPTPPGEDAAFGLERGIEHVVKREGRFAIRYVGPPGTVDRVSYAEVLAGAVPAERLAGRDVLIGMTAQGLGDTQATPVNGSNLAMPGVEAHANILYTLRSGDSIALLGPPTVAAVSAALLLALLAAFARFGTRVALPLAVGVVPLSGLASLLALNAGWWISPVPFAAGAVLAYPLWSWRRLERAVRGMDQAIARLQSDSSGARVPLVHQAQARRGDHDVLEARLHTLQRAGTLMRDARRFLADAVAALPTAMLVADENGQVRLANPQAAALFDVDGPDELLDLDLPRLLGEFSTREAMDWPRLLAQLAAPDPSAPERPAPSASLAVEARLAGRDFVVQVAAVDQQGQRRLIATIADVEPVKAAQRQRDELLAFVSHDLRSPAQSIVLLADLHAQGRLATPVPDLLHEMRQLAARTLVLSEDFVRTAHARSQALRAEPLALQTLADTVLAELRPQAWAARVLLHADVDPPPAAVQADRGLLQRALGNLVSNALKHAPPASTVTLLLRQCAGHVELSVADQGPGLAPAQLAQLARGGEGAEVGDARGVGLGLLFVQRVAQRHGGTLHAANRPEGGALLRIELPDPPAR